MARINQNYEKLAGGYLFPEIRRRVQEFQERNPGVKVIRLGIGDTVLHLPQLITGALSGKAEALGTDDYTGYGDEQGEPPLRQALAKHYLDKFNVSLDPRVFFVSDGAKPDVANIGSLFHLSSRIAIEGPAYPVAVDSSVIHGRAGAFNAATGRYDGVYYMPCIEENGFFPDLPVQKVDLIYLIRPNNPTGATATIAQLQPFVDYAIRNGAVIIFDVAYAAYQSTPGLVSSIYQVPGAERCAIEIGSFSKWAGFTGVRLGWSIVPESLVVEDSVPGELHSMWNRNRCTTFNGACNIAQAGGLAVLTDVGQAGCQQIVEYYMNNASIIVRELRSLGLTVYGGVDAPYAWVKTPKGETSWGFFDRLLNEAKVVCTPGAGFGPDGEGYIRLSAFGTAENINNALLSIKNNLKL